MSGVIRRCWVMGYTHTQMKYLDAIKHIEKDGFVKHFENGRSNIYMLTDKGHQVVEQLDRERNEWLFVFNKVYGIDAELCRRQFSRLYGNFNDEFMQALRELRLNDYPKQTAI